MTDRISPLRVLDLPIELKLRIFGEILEKWSAGSFIEPASRNYDDYETLGSFTYTQEKFQALVLRRSWATLNLNLVCKQFSAVCQILDLHIRAKPRHLDDFAGTYQPFDFQCFDDSNSEQRYRESWKNVKLAGIPPDIQPLDALLARVHTLHLPDFRSGPLPRVIRLQGQFPWLKRLVFTSYREGLSRKMSCKHHRELSLEDLSSNLPTGFLTDRAINQIWFSKLRMQPLRIFLHHLISHQHVELDERYKCLVSILPFIRRAPKAFSK